MPQQQQQQQQAGQMVQPQYTWEGGHLIMYHKEATGLPVVKDATVNDRDRMQDLLASEKYLTDSYCKAMNEASHDALFQVFKQNFDDAQQCQRQLFNTMFKKGWYKLPVADAQSVAHTHTQFTQYKGQFPFPTQSKQAGTSAGGTVSQQQLDQKVNQAIQQAQQGQVPHVQISSSSSAAAGQTASAGGTMSQQQLDQKVNQAIQQAQQGQVPGGYTAPSKTPH